MKFSTAFAAIALIAVSACTETNRGAGVNRTVVIANSTGVNMIEFNASNIDRDTWEENILGGDVLASGKSVSVNIDDGTGACYYDLRAIFADGEEVTQFKFNVCTETSWHIGHR